MTDFSKINEVQLDALREIGNIGAGHAATSLSGMINQKVMIDVCRADLLKIKDVCSIFNKEHGDMLDIQADFSGEIKGSIHCVMSKEGALDFMDMFKASPGSKVKGSTGIDMTVIKEYGSHMLAAYLKAIGDSVQFSLVPSPADAEYVHQSRFVSEVLSKKQKARDMVFCIKTAFIATGERLGVYFLFLTDQQGFELIFKHLRIE